MHGNGVRSLSTVHALVDHGSSSGTITSSAGANKDRTTERYRANQNFHVAGKQEHIGGHDSNNDHGADHDISRLSLTRMPKVNHQFGKDIIPNIFNGKQRNDFREWAENSALHPSSESGQKIQRCIHHHSVLMRVKFFWNGWSWKRNM